MEKLVGREYEKSIFQKLINSERAEFIAVYGRRRVGKTFLVDSLFLQDYAFSMTGIIDGDFKEQMHVLEDALDLYGVVLEQRPTNWLDAFSILRKMLAQKLENTDGPCIVFIDELPCLDTPKSGFVKALGYFWNSWASKQDRIKLIVCGSATSWMIDNIINSKGALHNRITHEIYLHPFTLKEVEEYLLQRNFRWTRLMILQTYMALGGIPYYLSMLDNRQSLPQNLDRLFFKRDAELKKEYRRLFATLFKKPEPYMQIVQLLAESKKGLNREQLAEKLGQSNNGHLGDYLEDLVQCDFIRKYSIRDKKVSNKSAIYQLMDFYSLFYLSFIGKAEVNEHFWTENLNTPIMNAWLGLSFERVCQAHVPQILKALRIDAISTNFYTWRSNPRKDEDNILERGAQIDLIIERADHIINVCEVKYSESAYLLSKEEDDKIRNRLAVFQNQTGTRCALWPTFITTFGLADGMYSQSIPAQVVLDDLFDN